VPEFSIEFAKRDQSLGVLREAAYRLIGEATCQIESTDDAYLCRLNIAKGNAKSESDLRARFLDLVTDENLREKIASETGRTRDLIVALAFGALAEQTATSDAS
jgi:His-Xaa-Ser system protein HxsD